MFALLLVLAQTASDQSAEILLIDGSSLRVSLPSQVVEVQTKYGKLSVPLSDVRRIEFGFHPEPRLEQLAADLGSPDFKKRVAAEKALMSAGPEAYPYALRASKAKDMEVARRGAAVLEHLRAAHGKITAREYDTLLTECGSITGKIVTPEVKVLSPVLGEITLVPRQLQSLRVNVEMVVKLDASIHSEQWLDVCHVEELDYLRITAEGQVDLWPQGPGQYVSGTGGFTANGKNESFRAGALIYRIGTYGEPRYAGSLSRFGSAETGMLQMRIVRSPWDNPISGVYTVKVQRK